MTRPHLVHATAVACGGCGVLLVGPPGAGKSDLALRLLDRGAELVADDQVQLTVREGRLLAAPPECLAGLIEVRGVGILKRRHAAQVPVWLAVDLAMPPPRLPPPPGEWPRHAWAGVAVPVLALAPFEPSAPLKVEAALRLLRHGAAEASP
ncbi:MAG: aldolase [Sphingomonadaceae bacterium]|uniref:HPr kinase/phosphorylase n=1 Tax=Thermaurantiacus sp. TaxID=2820283 RepID=UPI00298F24AF|nr:aldolase [Thermaurantiacus sp.]MCS6986629.1 aldolase [Sphingomonadaceae bacterium]MDW8414110.1 aldolase [Thermaurantiacus sp.]